MGAPVSADFLIIGSGIAGLRAAVELSAHGRVLVLTKSDPGAGSTGYAQGGIAAAVGDDDSTARHAADTIAAGDGICDEATVRVLVEDGVRDVRELVEWGAAFDRDANGRLNLAREGAHSVRRVLHVHDATGREIGRTLAARIKDHPNVTVIDHALVARLVIRDGAVAGVRFIDASGEWREARGSATLIATGGAGHVFQETTNPDVATGDGMALAFHAGARVADLEFVQFHPTALAVPGMPRYLLSEALRGEGGRLINQAGEPFMRRYEPDGDLAARDRVARAIVRESERTRAPVYLSMAHLAPEVVRARFPLIAELCRQAGLDVATDRLPVGPAAHYFMGGVETDLDGRTSLPGLFAAGEVACTGVHGANRLASNSLLEGLVFGRRAGRAMQSWSASSWPTPSAAFDLPAPGSQSMAPLPMAETEVRSISWQRVGVFRDKGGMTTAVEQFDAAWPSLVAALDAGQGMTPAQWRVASLLTVARLVARAALRRMESRGAHWRADCPERDDLNWTRHATDVRSV